MMWLVTLCDLWPGLLCPHWLLLVPCSPPGWSTGIFLYIYRCLHLIHYLLSHCLALPAFEDAPPPLRSITPSLLLHRHLLPRCFGTIHCTDLCRHYTWQRWAPPSMATKLLKRNTLASKNFVYWRKDNFPRCFSFEGCQGDDRCVKHVLGDLWPFLHQWSPWSNCGEDQLVSYIIIAFVFFQFSFILRKLLLHWAIRTMATCPHPLKQCFIW